MVLEIKTVKSKKQFKDFMRIFDYWHKQGKLGFVPMFILYRVKEQGQLLLLNKTSAKKKSHKSPSRSPRSKSGSHKSPSRANKSTYSKTTTDKVTPIGIAWVIPRKRPYEFYQLKSFAIDHDYLSQGYGNKFLSKLTQPLHKAGYDITTSVLTDNQPAINLYKKVGFKPIKKVKSAKGLETYEMIFPATKSTKISKASKDSQSKDSRTSN